MRNSRKILSRSPKPRFDSVSWLFRSNLPPRLSLQVSSPNEIQKREFFGLGEIVNVIANPSETVRSLTESRKLLQEAREEIQQNRERAQLRPMHTFSPLPGFFPRPAELEAIERTLEGPPSFTVLFGASSVGKTALLREVLSRDMYHVLHFDLRIAGFADLSSLYSSMSHQMEQYFETLSKDMEGYEEFEKEAWSFKHDRLQVEQRVENGSVIVKTSDIARLMELFQSCLLRYWQFEPKTSEGKETPPSQDTQMNMREDMNRQPEHRHSSPESLNTVRADDQRHEKESTSSTAEGADSTKRKKKIPVIFFDEAHKLPALIRSTTTMKSLLDSMLVLTKQDRLCHVIHATSDSFYQTWLRQLNVMQHCKIISIGDCSKEETRRYFEERLLPSVPPQLRITKGRELDFERLFGAFGGKLAHWADFVADYVNSNGDLTINKSSHFLQAHALLNLQIIHASEQDERVGRRTRTGSRRASHAAGSSSGGPRFSIYSPLHPNSSIPNNSSPYEVENNDETGVTPPPRSSFTALQLLKVMIKLCEPGVDELPYFLLCRELGVSAVDDMVRGRILELRWMDTVTSEFPERPHIPESNVAGASSTFESESEAEIDTDAEADASTVSFADSGLESGRSRSQSVVGYRSRNHSRLQQKQCTSTLGGTTATATTTMRALGPKLVPMTPILKYAMREVVREYDIVYEEEKEESSRNGNRSTYASFSSVDEY